MAQALRYSCGRCTNPASPGDGRYRATDAVLSGLARARDRLAGQIKTELDAAAFDGIPVGNTLGHLAACQALISAAEHLAGQH